MKISVVIPFFDRHDALSRTVATLGLQTTKPHEIIVVDDGANPPCRLDGHVRCLRIDRAHTYRGSSAAKNKGAAAATGDWLMFSDADILHMPDAIESMVAHLRRKMSQTDQRPLVTVYSSPFAVRTLGRLKWSPDVKSMEKMYSDFGSAGKLAGISQSSRGLVSGEQHCGLIERSYFMSLGGYDADTFKSWGYNNQELCLRVERSGGFVTSGVSRVSTGELLHCFHEHSPRLHDLNKRQREFESKYGVPYEAVGSLQRGG